VDLHPAGRRWRCLQSLRGPLNFPAPSHRNGM
jgi:hypothetical protein